MAVDTVPDGYPAIPILAPVKSDERYAFLEDVLEARLLDRHETATSGPAYMSIRIGDSVMSEMRLIDNQETRSAFYVYARDVDAVHRRAVDVGAHSIQEPINAVHGDRMGTVIDPFGNQLTIASRIEQVSIEELHRRLRALETK